MSAQQDFNAYQSQGAGAERKAAQAARVKARGHKGKPKGRKPHATAAPNRLDDPAYVTRPKTMRDILREADTSANLRYGGQEQALNLRTQQTPAWFEQYKGRVQGISQGIQTGYQKAMDEVAARTAATQTANDTSRNQLYAQAQADAASRGASVDPNVFKDDAAAANVRRQGADAQANQLAAAQQAQGGYFGGVQAAAGSAQIAQQQKNSADTTQLASDKGLYKSDYVTRAADSEHTKQLENQAYGVKQYTAEANAQNAAARIKTTQTNARAQRKATSRNERNAPVLSGPYAGLTHGEIRKLSPEGKQKYIDAYNKSKGKAGGLTPAQKKAQQEKAGKQVTRIEDAASAWNLEKTTKYDFGDGKGPRTPTPSEIKQKLGKKFNSAEIHLALMWDSPKPWTAKDRALAKRLGIRLPKKKAPKPVQTTTGLLNPLN